MTIDIIYFLGALILASLPTIVAWKSIKNKSRYLTMFIMLLGIVIVVGIVKTVRDSNAQNSQTTAISMLNSTITKMAKNRQSDSLSYVKFFTRLEKEEGIKRDSASNRPIIVNKSVYTHINTISHSKLNF